MDERDTRRTYTISEKNDKWLDKKSENGDRHKSEIVDRALSRYRALVEKKGIDEEWINDEYDDADGGGGLLGGLL